ncbi:MAG: response regulator, partial [Moorea sp. SIO2B7]|nr:response regulator [Moorena sp. SIO2B7]
MVRACAVTFPIMALKSNILLIDDTQNNLRFLSKILIKQGYQVRSVVSAEIALKVAKATNPDVIVLESLMPEMDGSQIYECLKADLQTRNIPVIFLSSPDQVPDKVKAFELGAADYITKPFQVEEVIASIENKVTISKL